MSLAFELDIFARTVWGEARGESFAGQVAVAWIIKNRSLDRRRRWPRLISAVCRQPKQFSCWNDGDANLESLEVVTLDTQSFVRATGVAALVMANDLYDNTKGANHYHALSVSPGWAHAMEETVRIGNHVFLRA